MPVHSDTELAPEILFLRLSDPWPTLEEQQLLRKQLIANGHLTEATRALIDLRSVTTPQYHEAAQIVAAAMKDGGLPRQRAYLAGSAVQFGFSRQLQSLAPPGTLIEVFTSEIEAIMWLKRPR